MRQLLPVDSSTTCRRVATRKVLLAHSSGSGSGRNGSARTLVELATNLDREHFEPVVLCSQRGELSAELEGQGIHVIVYPKRTFSMWNPVSFSIDTMVLCRLLHRERISIVHSSDVGGRRTPLPVASIATGIPYIQHVQCEVEPSWTREFGFRWASRILTCSHSLASGLQSNCKLRERTVVVHNGVKLSAYDGQADDCRRKLPAGRGPVIGFVGQLIPRKGVTTLIRAFQHVQQVFSRALLVIVGCSPPNNREYENECRRLVAELGMGDSVLFAGYSKSVPSWMKAFDVFAALSQSEPFGKVFIEAMAARCPVVATNVGGIPEIITSPDVGTLVPPDNPQAAAQAIEFYLRNPQRAHKVGENAARMVRGRFSVERMVRRIEDVYCEVLGIPTTKQPEVPLTV